MSRNVSASSQLPRSVLDIKQGVIGEIQEVLARRDNNGQSTWSVEEQTPLYTEGLGLDSLEISELSAQLEARFGRDPFTDGEVPQTVGEIFEYYSRTS